MRKVVRIEGGHGIAVRLYVAVELDDDAFLTTKGNPRNSTVALARSH